MRTILITATMFLLLTALRAVALEPDQIALVIDQNIPSSRKLAEYYAQARKIPDGRIIALDLGPGDEIPFDVYERKVCAPVREFLVANHLESKVTCLVTFFGVPLRVHARVLSPEDQKEWDAIREERKAVERKITGHVKSAEAMAQGLDANFKPGAGDAMDALTQRLEMALKLVARKLPELRGEAKGVATADQFFDILEQVSGLQAKVGRLAFHARPDEDPTTAIKQVRQQQMAVADQVKEVEPRRYEPANREAMRKVVRENLGLISYARLLATQAEYFDPTASTACVDSELSLLWWNYYPRARWGNNPLYFRAQPSRSPPIVMVMRLDAPQDGMVRDLIATSLKAETEGLQGQIVIDARGKTPKDASGKEDAYGTYDQTLRNLAALVREKTHLTMTFDDTEKLLPAHSCKDVAMYVGWYSVHHYMPCCQFKPGAVGFHIASSEMLTLRGEDSGWVRGLLNDGIAATLGPVAEPYLHSFPPADEFFPLLMTGKLTLAEAYWRTTPTTSWMIGMIGDPLYVPYKVNPVLKVEDLPVELRRALGR